MAIIPKRAEHRKKVLGLVGFDKKRILKETNNGKHKENRYQEEYKENSNINREMVFDASLNKIN
jgi:hypothetical protein